MPVTGEVDDGSDGVAGPAIYVVAFDTGYVKVGYTARPRARMKMHDLAARQMGSRIIDTWTSAPHKNARKNERLLIGYCASIGSRVTESAQGEYFINIDFSTVRTFAKTLPFEPIPESRDEDDDCAACALIDRLPLTALSLLNEVAIGELRITDSNGCDVSRAWVDEIVHSCRPGMTASAKRAGAATRHHQNGADDR
jgi:hypothetical protein